MTDAINYSRIVLSKSVVDAQLNVSFSGEEEGPKINQLPRWWDSSEKNEWTWVKEGFVIRHGLSRHRSGGSKYGFLEDVDG